MNDLTKAEISYKVKGKLIKFTIYHNLPNMIGLRLKDAFDLWSIRTRSHTAKSFVRFINNRGVGGFAMTERTYNKMGKS